MVVLVFLILLINLLEIIKILMNYIRKIGLSNVLLLVLCLAIILVAEYLFLNGEQLHGIFIGLWAPTLLGVMIYIKLINNGRK